MKIASIQLNIKWQDRQANFELAKSFVQMAKDDDCDLIVFPEMFNSGFTMNTELIAEPMNSETTTFLCNLAEQYQINIIAGFVETHQNVNENIAVCIDRTGILQARYVKNYPYTYAGESKHYQTGNKQVVFDIDSTPASLFICYDLRFPELFRKVAKAVEIIVVIASWPVARQDHWETLLKARAIENQCFIVGVNRIGEDGNGLIYGGGSHVYGPLGQDLSRGDDKQQYICTTIEPSEVSEVRKTLPFLVDMKSADDSSG